MINMELSNLHPSEVNFELCGLPLTLRPFTIADDLKSQKLCGGQKKLAIAFKNFDFEKLSLIGWYQLTLESQKTILKTVDGAYIDPETGEEKKANLTPIEKFRNLFIGYADQITLLTNLIKCKGLNIPDLDDEEALKKWAAQLKKLLPRTGR